jgi:hypothetical protein
MVFALAFAAFFYWQHFNHFRHVQVPATASRTAPVATVPAATVPVATVPVATVPAATAPVATAPVATAPAATAPAATAPAAVKPALAATSPKTDNHPALTESDNQVATKAATVGFADSLMGALSPSAKAATIQQEMQPAPKQVTETAKPAKRVAIQTAAVSSFPRKPQAMTAEQKRLEVAQDGFDHVLDMAGKYPDTYGFLPDERLAAAKLGDAIPVYRIAQQGRERYAGQPVSSLFKPADEWVYPIILENRIRYLVQVRYVGHDYVLGHGSRALAMAYDKILARWPASEGFHPQLVTIPDQPFYYFTIPELPDQNITDTSRMFDINPSLSPATIRLASWR